MLKNNDDKCFLYCYIREFLNPITKNRSRITQTVRDKELADKIIKETNLNFENVSISEIDKIEKKLKVNINVFSCNKKYKNKNPVRKSRENYDKILDLLLIEDINHLYNKVILSVCLFVCMCALGSAKLLNGFEKFFLRLVDLNVDIVRKILDFYMS